MSPVQKSMYFCLLLPCKHNWADNYSVFLQLNNGELVDNVNDLLVFERSINTFDVSGKTKDSWTWQL